MLICIDDRNHCWIRQPDPNWYYCSYMYMYLPDNFVMNIQQNGLKTTKSSGSWFLFNLEEAPISLYEVHTYMYGGKNRRALFRVGVFVCIYTRVRTLYMVNVYMVNVYKICTSPCMYMQVQQSLYANV